MVVAHINLSDTPVIMLLLYNNNVVLPFHINIFYLETCLKA
jgi:hypothetical protein